MQARKKKEEMLQQKQLSIQAKNKWFDRGLLFIKMLQDDGKLVVINQDQKELIEIITGHKNDTGMQDFLKACEDDI